jgi:hypothetical protein
MTRKTCLRIIFWLVILTCAVVAVRGRAQANAGRQNSNEQLVGVWNADTDGLPAATVVLTDEGGSLTGAIMFYVHRRETPDKEYTATPGLPEPMFNLNFDGEALTFQVSHRRAHPPVTLPDPPVTLRLKLLGKNAAGQMQAELTNLSERSPAAIAIRSDY